jgi:predicted ATPase
MPPHITRIEALSYRSLRHVSQSLSRFHVLVGANASGKSTFLDVVGFLSDLARAGLVAAVEGDARLAVAHRAPDAKQLVWMRAGDRFELAIEMAIPEDRRKLLKNGKSDTCRYEVAIEVAGELCVCNETFWLKPPDVAAAPPHQREMFPELALVPEHIVHLPRKQAPQGWRKVISRGEEPDRVTFSSEVGAWNNPFRLGTDRAALASLPEDEERFPIATWFRRLLLEGVQRVVLSSDAMRRPSAPGRTKTYLPDGSNLPHVVHRLETEQPERLKQWVAHIREALPDVDTITTREREEDRHRYLVIRYASGLEAPSWLVSDGTLRLLALTALAYAPDLSGVYLIEEPENGIHPRAVETVVQSLSSVYDSQVLVATHSPVVVSQAKAESILCFARTPEGATDVVRGPEHPRLKEWKGEVDLGTLLASGVLG